MMDLWSEKPINSLGTVVTCKTPSKTQAEFYENGDRLFISPKDLDWNQFYVTETETRITEKAIEKHKNQVLPRNAVMFTSLSFAFGKMGITSQPSLTNQQINAIIVNKEHDFRFVYYLLQQYRPIIFSYNSGIDTPIVPKSVFESILVKCPKLAIQKKIAAILSAYDDLIENNKRRIALLEKMAEEIYREWFVRFRFPGYQTAEFEKGIPKGWSEVRFDDFCTLKRGYDLPDSMVEEGSYPVIASTSIKTYHHKYKVAPPVITTGRSGSLGAVLISHKKSWPLNTTLYVKDFKGNNPYLIYYTLKGMKLEQFNAGAGVPSLNRNHLASLKLARPSAGIQEKFRLVIDPIHQNICHLEESVENLTKAKNLLLPRLISGKLSVENLDIHFPPSMQEVG